MANICFNDITFYSTDEAKIKKLHSDFEKNSDDFIALYTVIKNMGYDYLNKVVVDRRDAFTYLGEIVEGGLDDKPIYNFEICTESANAPNMQMLKALIEEEPYKGIELVHMSEEDGCGLYINTDTAGLFYDARYFITSALNEEYDKYSSKDFASIVERAMSDFPEADISEDDTIDEIESKIEPFLNEDDYYNIYEYRKTYSECTLLEDMATKAMFKKTA